MELINVFILPGMVSGIFQIIDRLGLGSKELSLSITQNSAFKWQKTTQTHPSKYKFYGLIK